MQELLSNRLGNTHFFLVIRGCQGIASQSLVPCNRSFSKAPISKQNVPVNLESGVEDLFFPSTFICHHKENKCTAVRAGSQPGDKINAFAKQSLGTSVKISSSLMFQILNFFVIAKI